jgi:hypothetical protein
MKCVWLVLASSVEQYTNRNCNKSLVFPSQNEAAVFLNRYDLMSGKLDVLGGAFSFFHRNGQHSFLLPRRTAALKKLLAQWIYSPRSVGSESLYWAIKSNSHLDLYFLSRILKMSRIYALVFQVVCFIHFSNFPCVLHALLVLFFSLGFFEYYKTKSIYYRSLPCAVFPSLLWGRDILN